MAGKKDYIVLFVEGQTECEFYSLLMQHYIKTHNLKISGYRIIDIKGISRFETRVTSKLKFEVLTKIAPQNIAVLCCYDTDVFELAQKPPVNWKNVRQKVEYLGISRFDEIKASRMIEDWFLKDLSGLCKFLNVEVPKKLEGKDGLEKIKRLFKKGKKPKVYQKGAYAHRFLQDLDIPKVVNSLKKELFPLELMLGIVKEIKKK